MADGSPLMVSVSGMRGIVGSSMTPGRAAAFAGAFGSWLVDRGGGGRVCVVVGRDGRAGGEMLHHAAIGGLTASGCDVMDIGVAMTPSVAVMVDDVGAAGGMVVTASHNPQQWNGLKAICRDASAPRGTSSASAPEAGLANEVIARFHDERITNVAWDGVGKVERLEDVAVDTHVMRTLSALGSVADLERIRAASFNVVLDSVNGSGRRFGRRFLEDLGCGVRHLGDDPSGIFSHAPEPIADHLTGLADEVRNSDAVAGFAQDPDADRLAIVDENGAYIGEEYTLALAARALIECGSVSGNAALCTNLSTSRMLDDVAAGVHGRVIRTPVGEANVVSAMKASGSALGGEGNGGVIWPAVTYVRDSLSSMGLVLALLAQTGKTVSELVSQMPAYAIEKRKVELADRSEADRAAESVASHWSNERVDRQDGVRVDFESRSAWVHVRASNTEPIMRLIAEAPTVETAREILDEAERVIG